MKEHGIQPVNLLVVNLYPFEQVIEKPHTLEDAIENIDIGGPAMVRAAAKNHPDVAVVTDPRQYKHLLREMKAHDGCTSLDFRRKLMVEAFVLTAAYDAAVSEYFGQKFNHNYFTRTQGAKALGANR
jgi:phosphoribosylaminoimidazolecarboxamide formyltransferase/IMP cyclohydrolase